MNDTVDIEYTAEAAMNRDRRTLENATVLQETGQIKYLDPGYEGDDLILVLDPDGDLWAREQGKPSTDGLFGSNARVVEGSV